MILGYHPSQALEVHSRWALFWACINWHVAPASQWSSTTSAVEKYRVTRTIFHYWKMNHSRTGSNCRQRKGEVTWRKAFEWGIEHFTYFISLWKRTATRGEFGDGSFRHVIPSARGLMSKKSFWTKYHAIKMGLLLQNLGFKILKYMASMTKYLTPRGLFIQFWICLRPYVIQVYEYWFK